MATEELGKRVWFFPDGDLPQAGDGEFPGHESLMVLNPNGEDADVTLTIYFEHREPCVLPAQAVPAQRVRCFRMDRPIGSFQVPFGQYAIKVGSTTGVICQIGRADVRQPNLAYYTVLGYAAD